MKNTITIEPKDFGKLHLVQGNRMISNSHVSQLVGEFKKFGDGNPSAMYNRDFPVLLNMDANGDYLIIDGQHRVEACKKLNIPVVAMVSDKQYTLGEIININTSQKGWSTRDIIESYSRDITFPHRLIYQEIVRLFNSYPEIPYTSILAVLNRANSPDGHNSSFFTKGKYEGPITMDIYDFLDYARKCYNALLVHKIDKKQFFYSALYCAYKAKGFNKERLLSKMSEIKPHANYILNCLEIQNLYNAGIRKEGSKIKLLDENDYIRLLK